MDGPINDFGNKFWEQINSTNVNLQELIDNNFSPIVYGLGFKYDPLKDWLIFKGNFSSNYRVPTLNDLYWAQGGNQYLNPEKGWSSEMGIVLNSGMKTKAMEGYGFMSESSYSITTFINQTQNWIQWIPTEFGYWSPKNVKQIENKGVEAKVEWNRSSKRTKIQAKLFYTYTHSRNKEFLIQNDERANRIPIYIPTHKANTYLSYSRRRLTFFYSQIYNGRVYIDESNSSYLPHYFPANTGISYFNVFKNLNYKIAGRINNLYNEPYQVVANRPIPGRNYSLNVTLKF